MSDVSAKVMAGLVADITGDERVRDPKAFRRFIREYHKGKGMSDSLPGKGGEYVFDDEQAEKIARAYSAQRSRGSVARIIFADDDEAGDDA